jgi:DNA-binding response OmpR family regulator
MPNRIHLLCVDDDADQRELLAAGFKVHAEMRFSVEFAEDLACALRRVESEGFDAILLDWFLPDACGVESIRKIRELNPAVPLIILTALDDMEANRSAIEASADGYLVKPAMPTNILHTLYSVILKKEKPDERVLRIINEIFGALDRSTDILGSLTQR